MEPNPFAAWLRAGYRARFRFRGQSLTELTIALGIAGILAATATPAMQNIVYEQRLTTYVNELFGDLQLARSEAIRRVAQVTLCKSSDGATCSTTSNWQSGWIVYADSNGNEAVDSGETIIKAHQALENGATLRYGTSYDYVYYKSDGTAWPNATFTFCDARGANYAKAIIVSNSGRARISSEASDGGSLSCS